jgi:LmbE family N-acetylglucosaminyl deacetylase
VRRTLLALVFLAGSALAPHEPLAQVRPVYDIGAARLSQLLQRLQTTASVLHTGAHPDDEDSAFLARAARGDHARTAYLSLTRGEGGQNIIGSELFDALGVIRTEELLQARRLDGAGQFFTRAFDYGFSKTRAEAMTKWSERDLLDDMVRAIRLFRPLVIHSRFSGTPADGHGHHQLAGYLTPVAFAAAADPLQFPEQLAEGLRPWRALKLYRGVGVRADPANAATIAVPIGTVDPVIGRSYAAIAAEGRSQHKSQGMGALEPLGAAASGLRLLETTLPRAAAETSIFDGMDVTVPGLAALAGLPAGTLAAELGAIDAAAWQALGEYRPLDPAGIVPALAAGLRATRIARDTLRSLDGSNDARAHADFLLAVKEADFSEALMTAAGVVVDPLADDETVVAGGAMGMTVRTFLANPRLARVTSAPVRAPAGWIVEPATDGGGPAVQRETPAHAVRYRVRVPRDAPVTQPYFLRQPRSGASYRWPTLGPRLLPFDAPLLTADVSLEIGGIGVTISRPVEYRLIDRVRGELRRAVSVAPAVSVGLDTTLLVIPTGTSPHGQRIVVHATSFSPQPITGTLRLRLPDGWTSTPATAPLSIVARGDAVSAAFVITVPARRSAATFAIAAEAEVAGAVYSSNAQVISYPHIQTHRLYSPASATVQVFDLRVARVRLGYVMGSGDQIPDALRRMGVDTTMLDADLLTTGDLTQFDTIVVGIRATETRPDFVANGRRLREFMEGGGTLIVQYQQGDYTARSLPPYPAQVTGDARVTDEQAPVRILAPEHPVFTFPNRIVAADFDGWVQERNLYAFSTFDSRYRPLLESSDPGEPPQRGGQVYAEVGRGRYIYTSYAWFRQLPAGVPGAYRQFANLVSLAKAPRR